MIEHAVTEIRELYKDERRLIMNERTEILVLLKKSLTSLIIQTLGVQKLSWNFEF